MSEDISKIAMIAIILEGMITYFKEFFVTGHKLELYGYCKECRKEGIF